MSTKDIREHIHLAIESINAAQILAAAKGVPLDASRALGELQRELNDLNIREDVRECASGQDLLFPDAYGSGDPESNAANIER